MPATSTLRVVNLLPPVPAASGLPGTLSHGVWGMRLNESTRTFAYVNSLLMVSGKLLCNDD